MKNKKSKLEEEIDKLTKNKKPYEVVPLLNNAATREIRLLAYNLKQNKAEVEAVYQDTIQQEARYFADKPFFLSPKETAQRASNASDSLEKAQKNDELVTKSVESIIKYTKAIAQVNGFTSIDPILDQLEKSGTDGIYGGIKQEVVKNYAQGVINNKTYIPENVNEAIDLIKKHGADTTLYSRKEACSLILQAANVMEKNNDLSNLHSLVNDKKVLRLFKNELNNHLAGIEEKETYPFPKVKQEYSNDPKEMVQFADLLKKYLPTPNDDRKTIDQNKERLQFLTNNLEFKDPNSSVAKAFYEIHNDLINQKPLETIEKKTDTLSKFEKSNDPLSKIEKGNDSTSKLEKSKVYSAQNLKPVTEELMGLIKDVAKSTITDGKKLSEAKVKDFYDKSVDAIAKSGIINRNEATSIKTSAEFDKAIQETTKLVNLASNLTVNDKLCYKMANFCKKVKLPKLSQYLMSKVEPKIAEQLKSTEAAIVKSLDIKSLLSNSSQSAKTLSSTSETIKTDLTKNLGNKHHSR